MIVWLLLFAPFFWLTMMTGNSTLAFVLSNGFGLLIALGNCIVGFAVCYATDFMAFTDRVTTQRTYLLIIVPCVLIASAMDFFVVFIHVQLFFSRFSGQSLFASTQDPLHLLDRIVELFDVHAVKAELYDEVISLLSTGYVAVPYIFEPFFTVGLPLWVAILRTKRDSRVKGSVAERAFLAPEVDIINPAYCDLICTSATFFLATIIFPLKSSYLLVLVLVFA